MSKVLNAPKLLLGVMAIACVRDCLEATLGGVMMISPFTPLQSFKHYLLHFNSFYLCVYCSLSLLLYWFAHHKVSINESFRIGALAMIMIWIAPVVDYLRQGSFIMAYPSNPKFVVANIHQFLNPRFDFGGMTWGMRVEIATAGLAAMCYLYLKTKRIFSSLLGGVSIILTCLVIGLLIPTLCQLYENGLCFQDDFRLSRCKLLHEGFILSSGSDVISLVFIALSMVLLMLAFGIKDRMRFLSLLKNFRFTRVLHYLLLLYSGMAIVYFNPPLQNTSYDLDFEFLETLFVHPANIFGLLMAGVSIVLSFESAVLVNDMSDYRVDAICNPDRPLVSDIFSRAEYRFFAQIFLVFALAIALCINESFFFLVLVYNLMAYLYSVPPFRLRSYFIVSSFVLSAIFLVTLHAGAAVIVSHHLFLDIPPSTTGWLLLGFALALNIKDIKDYQGDKKDGIYTFMTLLGSKFGTYSCILLVCMAICFMPFVLSCRYASWLASVTLLLFLLTVSLRINAKAKELLVTVLYYTYFIFLIALSIV